MAFRKKRFEIAFLLLLVIGMVALTPPVQKPLKQLWATWMPAKESTKPTVVAKQEPNKKQLKTVAENLKEAAEKAAAKREEGFAASGDSYSSPPPPPTPPSSAVVVPPTPVVSTPVAKSTPPKVVTKATTRVVTAAAKLPRHTHASPKATWVRKPVAPVVAHATQPAKGTGAYRWTKETNISCDPRSGCTLEWVLGQSPWPDDVKTHLLDKVKGERPLTLVMRPNWQGWMVRTSTSHMLERNAVANWGNSGVVAKFWHYDTGAIRYNLVRVGCKTWAGFTSEPVSLAPIANNAGSDLGVIPVAYCP